MSAKPVKAVGPRILRALGYTLAFLSLPALVGFLNVRDYITTRYTPSPPFAADLEPPAHDPRKPTAAVLMSNAWTEITDFLGPYEVLSASGAYNVYAVAPERRLSSLNGVLDVMPHYSFAELERRGLRPDIVVVPFIPNPTSPANAPIVAWIRSQAERGSTVLSVCWGAEATAESGILDGRKATSYWAILDRLERTYRNTRWVRGMRYVDDGDIISAAGVTSAVDGTLYLLKKLGGEALALEVARKIHYSHTRFLYNPARPVPNSRIDFWPLGLYMAYGWGKPTLGVALYDGVGELELASVLDTYPTVGAVKAVTVAQVRKPITTKHGLYIVPRADFTAAPELDRLMVPGVRPSVAEGLASFARERGLEPETPHVPPAGTQARYPFEAVFSDLAERENRAIAATASLRVEYPTEELRLEGASFPLFLLLRFFALGLVGVVLAVLVSAGIAALRGSRADGQPDSRSSAA